MALSPEQLQAMLSMAPDPNASAGALGHSTNYLTNNIGSAGQSLHANPGENILGDIGQIAGGVANNALKFGQSAVHAPGDIINGLQGKSVDTSTQPNFTGEGQKTFQGDFQSKTIPEVNSGKTSPLAATLKTVGGVVGSGLNFLGLGVGGKAAAQAAPDLAANAVQKGSDMLAQHSLDTATSRLASTGANMTKGEREAAIQQGRMTESGKYTPSETEQNAGEIMQGNTSSNPVKTLKAVQNEISNRGQEAETYLTQNATKISNEEDMNAFAAARNSSEKYMTPAETNAYDEQTSVFQKILKSYTSSENGGYTTGNYYKALKDYESQVTANIPKGKDALLVPGGSARLQAAKDVRTVVRNMIGDKNPEFKDKMYDLASLYDARDNVIANAEKGGATFAKQHPILNKTLTYGGEAIGAGALYEGAKKLGVPLP